MEDFTKIVIEEFKFKADFLLELHFRDGKIQTIDFSKINYRGWMKELEELEYFNKVALNECGNLAWPNGQDFMPEYLYDWDKFKHLFIDNSV